MRDTFLGMTVHVHHKGGNSQQEMQRANTLEDQRNQLMQQQLQMQQQQLAMVNPALSAIIQNGGMLPAQEAAMRTQALQGLGQQYQNLQGQLSQQLQARGITGGINAGSGDIARNFGQLGAMEAGQQSDLLNNIQLAKGQNLMNAIGTGLGEGSMFGQQALGFGGQAGNALGTGQQAANAADQASTGFWGSLVGGLTGLGGSAITKFCWVAAELYGGWYCDEAMLLRKWFGETLWIRPFALVYALTSWRWRAWIRRSGTARHYTKMLFDWFLREAHG